MSNRWIYTIIALLLAWFWVMVFGIVLNFTKKQEYDCSMVEYHPDYPVNIKKECRKIRT